MKLTFQRILDYPLKPVSEVHCDGKVIGLIERQKNRNYKTFVGSGFDCRYIGQYHSRTAAGRAIVTHEN